VIVPARAEQAFRFSLTPPSPSLPWGDVSGGAIACNEEKERKAAKLDHEAARVLWSIRSVLAPTSRSKRTPATRVDVSGAGTTSAQVVAIRNTSPGKGSRSTRRRIRPVPKDRPEC
jgi:hypothetical protein